MKRYGPVSGSNFLGALMLRILGLFIFSAFAGVAFASHMFVVGSLFAIFIVLYIFGIVDVIYERVR